MISLILFNNLYQDITGLSQVISPLEYKESVYGEEVKEFNFVSPGTEELFTELLKTPVKVTSVFRKPYPVIHFENFTDNLQWIGIAAIEDTILNLYKHKETESETVFQIKVDINEFIKECFDETKWEKTSSIKINKGSLVCIRPWMWHSIDSSLVQVFYLENNI